MKRVIIMGSPRSNGRSAHVAEMLFEANIDERPQDELFLVPISEVEVGPCIGCGACQKLIEVAVTGEDGEERMELRPRCVFDDDMQTLYDLIDDADELTIVSPVYFSGAPAMLKCLLDRLQPYYWANTRAGEKRPATLHIIGEGSDPHGYNALVSEVRSSLACAGFRLQRILDWVGKVDETGEIVAEAAEVQLDGPAASTTLGEGAAAVNTTVVGGKPDGAPAETPDTASGKATSKSRPKLSLSSTARKPASGKDGGQRQPNKGGKRQTPSKSTNATQAGKGAQRKQATGGGKRKQAGRGGSGRQSGKGGSRG